MQRDELLKFLTDFAAERLALLQRHEAGARVVSHYDFNNTYQYVISREETHVSWLETALGEFNQPLPAASSAIPIPQLTKVAKKDTVGAFSAILADDARTLALFVERWRPRLEEMTHARHRIVLNVVLGESLEHRRLFEQAAAGFEDVLGRRASGSERVGSVLSTRWVE